MEHKVKLNPVPEANGPPAPRKFVPTPLQVEYVFKDVPLNGSARFPRSHWTVIKKVYEYVATPEGKGKKFVVRPITPKVCRVWRIK